MVRRAYKPLKIMNTCSASARYLGQTRGRISLRWTVALIPPTHLTRGHSRATLDERQGHVSALLHLSASVFGAIGHLRRGGKQGLVRHSQPLLRPVHESHHPQYIVRKTRRSPCRWSHTGRCDGQPQTVLTRFETRISLRQVFHLLYRFETFVLS